jgi:predicted O-methyltransferase YrrM
MSFFNKGLIMFKQCFLLIFFLFVLYAEEPLPQMVDYSILRPSCDSKSVTWKTGQLAFNCAPEIGTFLTYLKKEYNIHTAVETGTFIGNTTVFLSLLFDDVYTIEIVEKTYQKTAKKLKAYPNVKCFLGSSEVILTKILPNIKGKRTLFYLDAHWDDHWPLREELLEISKTHHNNCVIVIDDFKVPGRKDIPYDKYKKDECSFEYIKDQLKLVFSECDIHYIIPTNLNSRAKFVALPKNWN